MPVPLVIWWGISLLVTAAAASAVVLKWDDIQIALKGKRLAILGARGVGKTHLLGFLTTGSIPAEYKQTLGPDKASKRRFQLEELNIKVKETRDVPGDKAAYGVWKERYDEADVVFYLLRADRLFAGDDHVEARVLNDLRHIGEWLEERKPRPPFFIIGTHCDLDPEFAGLTPDNIGDYNDKFRCLPIVSELVTLGGGTRQAKVVLGSMKTIQDTEALVYQIFMQVIS